VVDEVRSWHGKVSQRLLPQLFRVLPPGFPGRQDYTVLDSQPGHTDPDKARALLRQAGYEPGQKELSWPYNADDPG
jgi:ABC-type oligopeptide transport system substrate-binding subunit